jgi:hypothetical protein
LRLATVTVLLKLARSPLGRLGVRVAALLGLLVVLVGCGHEIAAGNAKLLLQIMAVIAVAVLAFTRRGAYIGILLLAAMNGLPFFDTSRIVGAKITLEEVAIYVLIATAIVWMATAEEGFRPSRVGRAISRAGAVLFLWYVVSVARTVVEHDVPTMRAAAYGRDFAFFALLLMVLPRIQLKSRDVGALLAVLLVGVCIFAVGQIMIAVGAGHPGSLIHFEKTRVQSGLVRVYARMTDLVTIGAVMGMAASLAAPQRKVRIIALPVTLLLMVSVVVQLTRARWVGIVVGLVVVGAWIMIKGETPRTAALRRRVTVSVGLLAGAITTILLVAPSLISSGTAVQRLTSLFTDLESNGGTVAARETATKVLKLALGEEWPLGLGFLPPSVHFVVGLPKGSLRDADLGVLNPVVTMGVVGAVLIYVPVILVLVHCLRALATERVGEYSWLPYGGAVWIVGALASSITLVTLFSTSGLALTGVVLAIFTHPTVLGARQALPATAEPPPAEPAVGFSRALSAPYA